MSESGTQDAFDLRALAAARYRTLAPILATVLIGAILFGVILLVLFADRPEGRLTTLEFEVQVSSLAAALVAMLTFLATSHRSSALGMTIEPDGVQFVRTRARRYVYPWKVVRENFRVIDNRGWEGRVNVADAARLVLIESRLRRTALSDPAFDALVSAAKARGFETVTRPRKPGSPTLVHSFRPHARV